MFTGFANEETISDSEKGVGMEASLQGTDNMSGWCKLQAVIDFKKYGRERKLWKENIRIRRLLKGIMSYVKFAAF